MKSILTSPNVRSPPKTDRPLTPSPGHPKALTVVPRADIRFYSPRQKFVDPIVSKAVINSETNNYVRDAMIPTAAKPTAAPFAIRPTKLSERKPTRRTMLRMTPHRTKSMGCRLANDRCRRPSLPMRHPPVARVPQHANGWRVDGPLMRYWSPTAERPLPSR